MTSKKNTAEGGTNGTVVTTANSGGTSGAAVDALVGTTPPTFTTAQKVAGAVGLSFQAASGATSIWGWTGFAGDDFAIRFSFRIPSNPTGVTSLIQVRNTGAAAGRVNLSTGGVLSVVDNTGTNTVWTAGAALSLNTWYDGAFRVKKGTTSTTGQLQFSYYLSSTPTVAIGTSYNGTTNDAGTTQLTEVRIGKLTASTWTDPIYFDNLYATDTAAGTLPGPVVAGSPTIVSSDRLRFIIDKVATAAGGGALTYSISQISGPTTAPTAKGGGVWEVVQSLTNDLVYRVSVAETGGDTVTSDATVPKQQVAAGGGIEIVMKSGGVWS